MQVSRFLIIAALAALTTHISAQTVYHVDDDAVGGDGSSWATAFNDLQDALTIAEYGDEIWVASGAYRPADIDASFIIPNGVQLLGGFNGKESAANQARPNANETILSGDLLDNDGPEFSNRDDNVLHVVQCTNVSATTVIDGFTIEGGQADGGSDDRRGAGMLNDNASPTTRRCIFRDNAATFDGAGMYNVNNSSPNVADCTFTNNSADFGGAIYNRDGSAANIARCRFISNEGDQCGGAVYNNNSNATYTNSIFTDNFTFELITNTHGGAIYNNGSSVDVVNCTLANNTAGGRGGGIYATSSSDLLIVNSIFRGNVANDGNQLHVRFNSTMNVSYSTVEDGQPGVTVNNATLEWSDNITDDPEFAANSLKLSPTSPAINAGDPTDAFACDDTDLEQHTRVLCNQIDMGAYEFGIGDWTCDRAVNINDWQGWQDCANDPSLAGCQAFFFNGNCTVNLLSYGAFQRVFAP